MKTKQEIIKFLKEYEAELRQHFGIKDQSDVSIAILKIKYVAKNYSDAESLKYDFIAWDSVIREFEIIGEAINILIKNKYFTKEKENKHLPFVLDKLLVLRNDI